MDVKTAVIPEKKRELTSFEIGELREPWEKYCEQNGVTSGEALCQVIQKLTGADSTKLPGQSKFKQGKVGRPKKAYVSREGAEGKQHRLYLTLTESELEAVDACAVADGFQKRTAWAIALIRAHLTDEPQFGNRDIEVLSESNHQLLAIGRNLNQIAHALNASRGKSTVEYDAELVQNLADAVKRHVKKVGDALRASIHRWTLS